MPKSVLLLALGLTVAVLVCSIPVGAVVTPLPGQGNQTGILFGVHPNAKTNETITAFIAEHGEIWWHEGIYNHTHKYVYIVPANACEEQLVYLTCGGKGGGARSPRSTGAGMKAEPPFLPAVDISPLAFYYKSDPQLEK